MKKIGKSFSAELAAAGLSDMPFSWGDNGDISFGDSMTAQQRDAVLRVYDAHNSAGDARAQLLSDVDAERARRWRSGFPVIIGGITKWFHSDEFSLTQHLGLKDRASDMLAAGGAMGDPITVSGQPVVWSTMDGSAVAITVQVAFDLVEAAGVRQAQIFAASQQHRAAIAAAAYLADYDVLIGWPAVFGDPA